MPRNKRQPNSPRRTRRLLVEMLEPRVVLSATHLMAEAVSFVPAHLPNLVQISDVVGSSERVALRNAATVRPLGETPGHSAIEASPGTPPLSGMLGLARRHVGDVSTPLVVHRSGSSADLRSIPGAVGQRPSEGGLIDIAVDRFQENSRRLEKSADAFEPPAVFDVPAIAWSFASQQGAAAVNHQSHEVLSDRPSSLSGSRSGETSVPYNANNSSSSDLPAVDNSGFFPLPAAVPDGSLPRTPSPFSTQSITRSNLSPAAVAQVMTEGSAFDARLEDAVASVTHPLDRHLTSTVDERRERGPLDLPTAEPLDSLSSSTSDEQGSASKRDWESEGLLKQPASRETNREHADNRTRWDRYVDRTSAGHPTVQPDGDETRRPAGQSAVAHFEEGGMIELVAGQIFAATTAAPSSRGEIGSLVGGEIQMDAGIAFYRAFELAASPALPDRTSKPASDSEAESAAAVEASAPHAAIGPVFVILASLATAARRRNIRDVIARRLLSRESAPHRRRDVPGGNRLPS